VLDTLATTLKLVGDQIAHYGSGVHEIFLFDPLPRHHAQGNGEFREPRFTRIPVEFLLPKFFLLMV